MPFPCPLIIAGPLGCGKHNIINKIPIKDQFLVYDIPNKLKSNNNSTNLSLNDYLFSYYNSKMMESSTFYHIVSIFSSIAHTFLSFFNNNKRRDYGIDTYEILRNTCNNYIQNIIKEKEDNNKTNENDSKDDEMKMKFNYSSHMFDQEGGGSLENYFNPEDDKTQFDPILHDFPLPTEEVLSNLNSEEKIQIMGKELETLDSNMLFKLPSNSMKIILSITSDDEDINSDFINKIMNENDLRSVVFTTVPFIQDSIKNVFYIFFIIII